MATHPPDELGRLNAAFYETSPWMHLDRRLNAILVQWSHSDAWNQLAAQPIVIEPLRLEFSSPPTPEAAQAHLGHLAVELVVLLHEAAETLTRQLRAHAGNEATGELPACPALELDAIRNFKTFKRWVRERLVDSPSATAEMVRLVLGDDDTDGRTGKVADYVREIARYSLDGHAYNAAKHGLAIDGEHSQVTVTVEDLDVIDDGGIAISWFEIRDRAPHRVTRWYSLPVLVLLCQVTSTLLRQLWMVGARRYAGGGREQLWCPPALTEMMQAAGTDRLLQLELAQRMA
jgi:hypothetical protein